MVYKLNKKTMKQNMMNYIENNYKKGDGIYIEDFVKDLDYSYKDVKSILDELDEEGFFNEPKGGCKTKMKSKNVSRKLKQRR